MDVIESLIPISNARPGIKLTQFRGVTIHNTGNYNKGAGARRHKDYMHNDGKKTKSGFHYVVDDSEIYRVIPEDEVAWHAGDGRGAGNMSTVSIEICVNPDSNLEKAIDNASWLSADILYRHGENKVVDGLRDKINGNLFQHYSWSGKNCPKEIRDGAYGGWDEFIKKTTAELANYYNTNSDINAIVDNLENKGYIKDRLYWYRTLSGDRPIDNNTSVFLEMVVSEALNIDYKQVLVDAMYDKGVIKSKEYWYNVFIGEQEPKLEYLATVLERI